jgi:protein-S-isoprenylcysteine O-methyltransferase Ste14
MKTTAFEFRHRFWIIMAIYVFGFVAPWNVEMHLDGTGPNAHLWGMLAALLSKTGIMSIQSAFNVVLGMGILCAVTGAWLRTWGSAYLGADVMSDATMRGEGVVADGPYRHLRNPLYLGAWVNTLAVALLMPASGAVFTIVLIVLFQMRAYCARVPRLLPALRPRIAASGARARWTQAVLAEIMMWGVTVSFAVLGWRYNAFLLTKCVLVWLGVSLVVRAFRTQNRPAA